MEGLTAGFGGRRGVVLDEGLYAQRADVGQVSVQRLGDERVQ